MNGMVVLLIYIYITEYSKPLLHDGAETDRPTTRSGIPLAGITIKYNDLTNVILDRKFLIGASYNHPHVIDASTPRTASSCIRASQGGLGRTIILDESTSTQKKDMKLPKTTPISVAVSGMTVTTRTKLQRTQPVQQPYYRQYLPSELLPKKGRLFAKENNLANVDDEVLEQVRTSCK